MHSNCYYLNPLLEKLAKEQKDVFLLFDSNVDLLKYEQHKATNKFLDSLSSISIKNNLFSDFINKEDLTQKTECHMKHKSYRNMLSTLIKKVNKTISPRFLKIT